jgi:polyvinyl alcohol dehydrogenase (cytochrome)
MKWTFILIFTCTLGWADGDQDRDHNAGWPTAGHDLRDSRSASGEEGFNPANVSSLKLKWTFTTGGDVSATPTVADDAIYFPDWAGNLYAVDRKTGAQIWTHKIEDYNKVRGSVSRVSPAVHDEDLILGDIQDPKLVHKGASIMAVNRHTGALRWITQVDSHPAAIITGSPIVYGDVAYVGVSSIEESLAVDPAYPCCSFRGSLVALSLTTGQILWQTYTVPGNGGKADGYSGGAIWQPPAIDPARGSLFIGTGNNYEVPQSVKDCLANANPAAQPGCFAANDYYDAAMSLDLKTGAIKWAKRVQGLDVWTVACLVNPNPVSCPEPSSPDYDFSGSGPNLLPHLVGYGQKSGIYWAFNPDNGNILWSTVVGPGSTLGGIEWGTASDGKKIFVAIANGGKKTYPLIDGTTTTGGAWSAIDASNGKLLWQTADPLQMFDLGSVTSAGGVVFAPSVSGNMHALDANSGKILWTFDSGGSIIDGPSVVENDVYFGSGYKIGTHNTKVFAFESTGHDGNHDGDAEGKH